VLEDALAPVHSALARVEARLTPMEAALTREGAVRARQNTLAETIAPVLTDAFSPIEAALARLEAKLAPVEAALAREDATHARPHVSLWSSAASEPTVRAAAVSSPAAASVEDSVVSLAGAMAPLELVLARIEAKLNPTEAAPPPDGATRAVPSAPFRRRATAEPAPLGRGASAASSAPEASTVAAAAVRPAPVQAPETRPPPEGGAFSPKKVEARNQEPACEASEEPMAVGKRRKYADMEPRTLFGYEHDYYKHLYNTTSNPVTKKSLGLLLSYLDFVEGLQEPEREGCLANFIQSRCFEICYSTVIVGNAAYMAYSADQISAVEWEFAFVIAYTVEIILKLMVHKLYFFVNSNWRWNIFDFFLVVVGLIDMASAFLLQFELLAGDAIVLRCLRVLKLVRILRVLRILKVFNDLRLMLTSAMGSCISLAWSFVLLFFVCYLFALIFRRTLNTFVQGTELDPDTEDEINEHFGSVRKTVLSLYKAISGGADWGDYYAIIAQAGATAAILFLFFTGFIQISILNILTSVFVERAMRLAQPDTMEQAREQRLKERADADELHRMCLLMDRDHSGTVSVEEFRDHLMEDKMRCCFSVLGLDIGNAQEFFEMLASMSERNVVDVDTFVEGCMNMRGAGKGITQQKLIMDTRRVLKAQEQNSQKLERIVTELLQQRVLLSG